MREREKSKNQRIQKIIAVLIIFIGLALLIYMIVVESEPGAVPLGLMTFGTGWYFIIMRSHHEAH